MKAKFLLLIAFVMFGLIAKKSQSQTVQENVLQFTATPTQYATVPISTNNMNLGNQFTMSAWVFFYSNDPWSVIMGKTFESRHVDPWLHYALMIDPDGNKIVFSQSTGIAGSLGDIVSTTTFSLNEWVHIAATLKNDTMRLYLNGVLEAWGISAGAVASSNVPFAIGAGAPLVETRCCGFNGAIKQAGVWNIALTATQIIQYAGTSPVGNEPGLRAFWPLNEGSGQSAADISANNADLTLGLTSDSEEWDGGWIKEVFVNNGPYFIKHSRPMPDTASNYADFYVLDYNSDGTDDLINTTIVVPPTVPATYANIKVFGCNNGVLSNTTAAVLGDVTMVHPRHTAVDDFNHDGLNDIFIVGHGTDTPPYGGEQSKLLVQNIGGTLQDITATSIPASSDFTHHVCAGDVNGDTYPDIFMDNIYGGTYGPRLYFNNSSCVFTVSSGALYPGVSNMSRKYCACHFIDVENDGDLDLFLGGHGGYQSSEAFPSDIIYLNDGTGNFDGDSITLPDRLGGPQWGTLAVAQADFDHNGYNDLVLSVHHLYTNPTIQILLNNGDLTFTDATDRIPKTWPDGSGHICWIDTADFNHDGWTDLLISKGGDIFPYRLFFNSGQGKFIDATFLVPIALRSVPAARPGYFDSDSHQDILTFWFDQYIFFENVNNFENSIATINPSGLVLVPDTNNFSLTLSANTGADLTYKWIRNGVEISGQTGPSLLATMAGSYHVVVKHSYYPADTSIVCRIGQEEPNTINETADSKIVVSPNPTTGIFHVQGLTENKNHKIVIHDSFGRAIKTLEVNNSSETINCTDFPSGIYYIQFTDDNSFSCTKKIVKL